MSGGNFLSALLTFPKDTINDETVELLEPYLSMEDFNIEQVCTIPTSLRRILTWNTFVQSLIKHARA